MKRAANAFMKGSSSLQIHGSVAPSYIWARIFFEEHKGRVKQDNCGVLTRRTRKIEIHQLDVDVYVVKCYFQACENNFLIFIQLAI